MLPVVFIAFRQNLITVIAEIRSENIAARQTEKQSHNSYPQKSVKQTHKSSLEILVKLFG